MRWSSTNRPLFWVDAILNQGFVWGCRLGITETNITIISQNLTRRKQKGKISRFFVFFAKKNSLEHHHWHLWNFFFRCARMLFPTKWPIPRSPYFSRTPFWSPIVLNGSPTSWYTTPLLPGSAGMGRASSGAGLVLAQEVRLGRGLSDPHAGVAFFQGIIKLFEIR